MKLGEMELSDFNSLTCHLEHDLTNTEVRLGDFIRLSGGLAAGQILELKNDGSESYVILIGNATPYEGISSVSHDGWDWDFYNTWILERVYRLRFGRILMGPGYVKRVGEILKAS